MSEHRQSVLNLLTLALTGVVVTVLLGGNQVMIAKASNDFSDRAWSSYVRLADNVDEGARREFLKSRIKDRTCDINDDRLGWFSASVEERLSVMADREQVCAQILRGELLFGKGAQELDASMKQWVAYREGVIQGYMATEKIEASRN